MTWQSILTAPKDGARILLYEINDADDVQPQIGEWDKENGGWRVAWDHTKYGEIDPDVGSIVWNVPTHWHPLPAPPTKDQ